MTTYEEIVLLTDKKTRIDKFVAIQLLISMLFFSVATKTEFLAMVIIELIYLFLQAYKKTLIENHIEFKTAIMMFEKRNSKASPRVFMEFGNTLSEMFLTQKRLNLKKIKIYEFIRLKKDEINSAYEINKNSLNTVKEIIKRVKMQPEIYLTYSGGLQIEYKKSNEDYLIFEFPPNQSVAIYTYKNSVEIVEKIKNCDDLVKEIDNRSVLFFNDDVVAKKK